MIPILDQLAKLIAETAAPASVSVHDRISAGRLPSDDGLLLVCLARGFCAELAAHGRDAQATWEALASLSPELLDNLKTIDGWATLSAFITGGAIVLRLPRLQDKG